ncbi:MAG: M16 family metallopeptidase, partial [Bryobacteraceae bacterium]
MISRIALVLVSAAGLLAAQTPATKPAAKKAAAPRAAAASYKDLKFPPLRQVQIPSVETHTLPNGMKLYLLENHELPLVSGFALVRTGNLFDPADKAGTATMTGIVMRTGGTRAQTGDALDEKLENIAASVESSIDETSGRVSFSALKENITEVLAAFYDVTTAPEFRQDKIELARTRLRSSIARRNDDPHGIVQREFSDILYGRDNPYGWRMEYEHIDRITRDDLAAFHRRYFFPENVMLAVHGDFKSAEMKAQIEKLFAGWTVKQPAVPPFPPVTNKPKPGVYLAAKTDVTQTFFALGHQGGMLKDKDYPALEVMADILGGGFRSRLFDRVRTKLGKAYSISASWGANYNHPGLFQISGST